MPLKLFNFVNLKNYYPLLLNDLFKVTLTHSLLEILPKNVF